MSSKRSRLPRSIRAIPQSCTVFLQVVTDTLALLVAALALLPDRQPAIMSALLMLLIEVSQQPFCLAVQNEDIHSAPHDSLQCIGCAFSEFTWMHEEPNLEPDAGQGLADTLCLISSLWDVVQAAVPQGQPKAALKVTALRLVTTIASKALQSTTSTKVGCSVLRRPLRLKGRRMQC